MQHKLVQPEQEEKIVLDDWTIGLAAFFGLCISIP